MKICKKIKFTKKKILICGIIVLLIMGISLGVIINTKNNISKIETKEKKEEIPELFSYRVLDNSTEKIKGIVNVQSENGIQEIEYPKMDGTVGTTKLQCNGKNSVSIDYNVEFEKEYNFKIITNTGTENKVLKVDSNELAKYINIEKLPTLSYYNSAKIEYNNEEQITQYYKIKEIDTEWKLYNGEFALDEIDLNLTEVTINAKTVEQNGNTIQNEKKIALSNKPNTKRINVFDDYEIYETSQGMTLEQYGFSYEGLYQVEGFAFQKRNFYISHGNLNPYYGGTFVLDCSRFEGKYIKRVLTNFEWWSCATYWGGPWFSVDIVYKDGTSNRGNCVWNGTCYVVDVYALKNEISCIKFNLSMRDGNSGWSYGALRDIDLIVVDE